MVHFLRTVKGVSKGRSKEIDNPDNRREDAKWEGKS